MKYFLTLLILYAVAFSLQQTGISSTNAALADTTDINPNGSSELSLLMREMHRHALQARQEVITKKLPKGYPPEFEKLYSAKPTTPTTKNQYYNNYADLYMSALRSYAKSNRKNHRENYNNLVSACVVCHTTHCPGPMVLIEKLPLE